MNIQTLYQKAPVTLLFILSFVGFAVYQLIQGVNFDQPSSEDLLRFGANFLPLTLTHEPWRLVTSAFLHIGLLHLLFNSFAMYYFGQVVEQIVGRGRFLVLFLLSAMGGSLLNLYITWQEVLAGEGVGLSAGASGGIMGLGMFLLVLALTKTPTMFVLNTNTLASVMGLNFVMGFAIEGIDNAAHFGGACVGALCALLIWAMYRWRLSGVAFWLFVLGLLVVFGGVWWQLHGEVMALMHAA
ncbi:rhomboid family intramembrane serine protease [Moraxella nasibovis]|uniref:rhomboid family intramembrane serine protease n=1 Tax=Moraxella nasibovis TaxID=2904120 RepID=UPI0024101D09|nr:rhomboid family intramembrane serine protease [Moraxella nasibovis]WFF39192.1 rhomboid family intramembrane serine protease [Moraxella nasibovis]